MKLVGFALLGIGLALGGCASTASVEASTSAIKAATVALDANTKALDLLRGQMSGPGPATESSRMINFGAQCNVNENADVCATRFCQGRGFSSGIARSTESVAVTDINGHGVGSRITVKEAMCYRS